MERLTDSDVARALRLKIMPAALLLERLHDLEAEYLLAQSGTYSITEGSTMKGSILDDIWGALHDYEATAIRRVFSDEERRKAGRAVDHEHHNGTAP